MPDRPLIDVERQLEFDFLRTTEMAALATLPWLGKGRKEDADAAACDAMRGMFDLMDIRGEVVIGEGIKDEAPGIFYGERLGYGGPESPRFEIAVDPVDGTTNVSKGMSNSLSCLVAAQIEGDCTSCLQAIPAFYLQKLAYPLAVRRAWMDDPSLPIDIDAPIGEVIDVTARILGKDPRDVVVCVLDRPRNAALIEDIRRKGAALRMIVDGDIAAALAPAMQSSPIDLYAGIGGAPEGVLAAAALRCLGGGMRAKIWVRDEAERQSLIQAGWGDRLDRQFMSRDLAMGKNIIFAATGITQSPLVKGVEVTGNICVTHSVLMRARSGTVRFIEARHDLSRKTLHRRSTRAEGKI
ncbi:MAG: class II fructose-bisphosphatase [Candidatus Methylacidiphilales bacterium]|nr:class II fructose-bisphosphatase [Candidatus Methylacidiphilales bacterium]